MFFSHVERDLQKSFFWAHLFCVFPYKCHERALVLDKRLACGFGLAICLAICFLVLNVYTMVSDGSMDVVKGIQLGVSSTTAFSILAIPILRRRDLTSIVDEMIGLEGDLRRLGLAATPQRSMRCAIFVVLCGAGITTYDLAITNDYGVLGVKRVGFYVTLGVFIVEGDLTMSFVSIAGDAFTLLNASAHRPTRTGANQIDVLTDLHQRAVDVSRRINDVFSSFLALVFLATLSAVTTSSYGILQQIKLKTFARIPVDLFWMISQFALTARIVNVFSGTEKEAFLNYKLTIDRLSFTAKGFVDIHPSILLTILSCAVTYLIILID